MIPLTSHGTKTLMASLALALCVSCAAAPKIVEPAEPVPDKDVAMALERSPVGQLVASAQAIVGEWALALVAGMPEIPARVDRFNTAIDAHLNQPALTAALTAVLRERLTDEELSQVVTWQLSSDNAELVQLTMAVNAIPDDQIEAFRQRTLRQPIDPARIALAEQLTAHYVNIEAATGVFRAHVKATRTLIEATCDKNTPDLVPALDKFEASMLSTTGLEVVGNRDLQEGFLFAFQTVEQDRFEEFVAFWASPLGRKYRAALWEGYATAVLDAATASAIDIRG